MCKTCIFGCVAHFEAEYTKLEMVRGGDFGSVFAGRSKRDNLPVSNNIHILIYISYSVPCSNQSTPDWPVGGDQTHPQRRCTM